MASDSPPDVVIVKEFLDKEDAPAEVQMAYEQVLQRAAGHVIKDSHQLPLPIHRRENPPDISLDSLWWEMAYKNGGGIARPILTTTLDGLNPAGIIATQYDDWGISSLLSGSHDPSLIAIGERGRYINGVRGYDYDAYIASLNRQHGGESKALLNLLRRQENYGNINLKVEDCARGAIETLLPGTLPMSTRQKLLFVLLGFPDFLSMGQTDPGGTDFGMITRADQTLGFITSEELMKEIPNKELFDVENLRKAYKNWLRGIFGKLMKEGIHDGLNIFRSPEEDSSLKLIINDLNILHTDLGFTALDEKIGDSSARDFIRDIIGELHIQGGNETIWDSIVSGDLENNLYDRIRFVGNAEKIVIVGSSGTGKTKLVDGLTTQAGNNAQRVYTGGVAKFIGSTLQIDLDGPRLVIAEAPASVIPNKTGKEIATLSGGLRKGIRTAQPEMTEEEVDEICNNFPPDQAVLCDSEISLISGTNPRLTRAIVEPIPSSEESLDLFAGFIDSLNGLKASREIETFDRKRILNFFCKLQAILPPHYAEHMAFAALANIPYIPLNTDDRDIGDTIESATTQGCLIEMFLHNLHLRAMPIESPNFTRASIFYNPKSGSFQLSKFADRYRDDHEVGVLIQFASKLKSLRNFGANYAHSLENLALAWVALREKKE